MDARRIAIALVLALVLSGGATYFLYYRLRSSQSRPQVSKIVSAAHPVSAGQAIKVDDVALIDWPLNIPLAGSFSKIDDVVGRALIYPLGEKEPVLQRDLAEPGSGIGLSVKIPPGMRATSIRSNEIIGVAGFLFPGSHVDVLDTYTPPSSNGPITETVLQNVEVITAGQKIQPDPQGKPETVSVVTLLLNPKDSEKLLLASTQGTVQFILRNGADTDQAKTPPVSIADLMGVVKPPTPVVTRTSRARAPKVVSKAPPPPEFYTIEVIQGKERSEQKFPESGPK